MHPVIEQLKLFNSKERFFLLGYILGNETFDPSPQFRQDLEGALHLHLPTSVSAAMDYHLDWLYASLYLATYGEQDGAIPNENRVIAGQQEDIDFLIAYEEGADCHLVLIEAKGVGSWTNAQMNSKKERFATIFRTEWPHIIPHFLLMSPARPQRLRTEGWPVWMVQDGQIPWLKLRPPETLKKVTRCDAQGNETRAGEFWQAVKRKLPNGEAETDEWPSPPGKRLRR